MSSATNPLRRACACSMPTKGERGILGGRVPRGWVGWLLVALLVACGTPGNPDVVEGSSLLHGDSVPRVTLTRVAQGSIVWWFASPSSVDGQELTIVGVQPVAVPSSLTFEGVTRATIGEVPTLAWAGEPSTSRSPLAIATDLRISLQAGQTLDPGLYLRFRVNGDVEEETATISDVRWVYEKGGRTYGEVTRQVLRLTGKLDLGPEAHTPTG